MAYRPAKVSAKQPLEHTVDFLKQLEKHNSFEWFKENRDYYEATFLIPAQQLVLSLGDELRKFSPDLHALPKIDKSIFRLHRDIRFSKNKQPFKTHLGILMWEGDYPKMECSGYYFQLTKAATFLATGTYMFSKQFLQQYRKVVSDPKKAAELLKLLSSLAKKGYIAGGKSLKKAPRGVAAEDMNEALLYTAVYAYIEFKPIPQELFENPERFCTKHFKAMCPLHRWLQENVYAPAAKRH